jgi:predicted HicB family RNase H-like nuclease
MTAAPTKEPSRRRTKYVMVRVTREEHRYIRQFAKASRKTIADLVREAVATFIKKGVNTK